MLDKLKKQNALVIALEFAMIAFVIIGISYALYSFNNNFKLKTVELGIDTEVFGTSDIDSDNIKLLPILDNEVSTNETNVLKINFKVRGNSNNIINNIIYDISLVNLKIDCELLSEYLKWELLKNEEVISTGSMSPNFDTIVDDRLVLTNIQQDLVAFDEEPDDYEFRLWISDSCQNENILECQNKEDQKNLLNKSISGRIEVELYTGSKSELERIPTTENTTIYNNCIKNLDTSNANKPNIDKNMIAVYYDEQLKLWKKADEKNSNQEYKWYDYNKQQWANAVIVKDYKKYKNTKLGSEIKQEDIVAFYVWIPRYSYQVWNLEGKKELSQNYLNGININFEHGLSDSGSITCTETQCVGNNLEWITHPVFTQNNTKGFWISKYEISGSEENPLSVENEISLINYEPEKSLSISLKLLDYGIQDLKLNLISNQEWGAINYLAYSKYGICNENECKKEIDSTTNNIYGIYDLESKNNEQIKNDWKLLGSALNEFGIETTTLTDRIIYRKNMIDIVSNKEDYAFRNMLY